MQRITSILLASILLMFPFAEPANAANGNAKAKPWMDKNLSAEERTELLLDAMTLDQKIQQIAVSRFNENDKGETIVIKKGGTNKYQSGEFPPEGTLPGCEFQDTGRQIRGIEELGIPTIRMTNGGTGVKGGSCKNDPKATGLPSTLALAATFNRELNYEAGRILGQETRAFAHQVMLGPGMNLVRHPYGGRNYEYFSEDPYLTPEIVDPKVNGESARKMAEEGIVLLKNENNFLPLDGKPKSIALIGVEWFAGIAKMSPRSVRDNNENVNAHYTVTPKEGLENVIRELGYNTKITYNDGRDPKAAAKLAAESDLVILMIGDNPHETKDRETLGFPPIDLDRSEGKDWVEQEPLIDAVLKDNAHKTVVVLKTSGAVLMPWLDKVPAVLQAWYPGMEDGNAVANILYGKVNPSGKLPVTFPITAREAAFATEEQFPGTRHDTGKPGGPGPYGDGSDQLIAKYSEGLEMGYRWYEANNEKPLFPFGFGLSYTTFKYDDLKVTHRWANSGDGQGKVSKTNKKNMGKGTLAGIEVSFTITNTGSVAGKEAAQVYLTLPDEAGEPAKRLVGFEKVHLEPGESKRVTVTINKDDSNHPFSYFKPKEPDNLANWADGEWVTADGTYRVHVGGSSADTPLEADVPLVF